VIPALTGVPLACGQKSEAPQTVDGCCNQSMEDHRRGGRSHAHVLPIGQILLISPGGYAHLLAHSHHDSQVIQPFIHPALCCLHWAFSSVLNPPLPHAQIPVHELRNVGCAQVSQSRRKAAAVPDGRGPHTHGLFARGDRSTAMAPAHLNRVHPGAGRWPLALRPLSSSSCVGAWSQATAMVPVGCLSTNADTHAARFWRRLWRFTRTTVSPL
jgi:hypothetical protein